MCLTPLRLRTSSIYRNFNGYSKFYVDVPCGHCAECMQQRKNDWYLRNYFEAESLFKDADSYIMLISLTYDDEHLPTTSKILLGTDINRFSSWSSELDALYAFSDKYNISKTPMQMISIFKKCNFSCFDYTDIQKFLKLLRIKLERAGYNVVGKLRYFLASEYGHDDIYVDERGHAKKGTNRPHYHLVPYISGDLYRQGLTPELLSVFISACWTNGRTDGMPYKDKSYVLNHSTFGPRYIKDPVRLRGVHYYVCKYVCKDYEFSDTISRRISYILTQLIGIDYNSNDYKERKREFERFMGQFHRQSESFGFQGLIDSPVMNCIMKEGKIKLPDKDKIVKTFNIPLYYIRKLFQRCVKDAEGRQHWIWNDLGKQWKKSRLLESIDIFAGKMKDWYDGLYLYVGDDCYDFYKSSIDNLLQGRSWRDYAEYIIFYKGRFCKDRLNPDDIDTVIDNSLSDPYSNYRDCYKLISKNLFTYKGNILTDLEIEDKYVIKDDCFGDRFKGFDELYDLFHVVMISWNLQTQLAYEEKMSLTKKYNELGLKTKKKI